MELEELDKFIFISILHKSEIRKGHPSVYVTGCPAMRKTRGTPCYINTRTSL